MDVCVYVVWMYVCMDVCVYGCMCVWMYVCMDVCVYGCMCVCMYVCVHVCVYGCMYGCVCMYLIMNERTGSGILIKKLLFSNFVPGIRN